MYLDWLRVYKAVLLAILLLTHATPAICAEVSADPASKVQLIAFSDAGVPVHPGPGDRRIDGHIPGGTQVTILKQDARTRWFKIRADRIVGWVAPRYVPDKSPEGTVVAGHPNATYVFGTWNLEYFKDGKQRGFPEYTGKKAIPPRTAQDYQTIADAIRILKIKVLITEEVSARPPVEEDEDEVRSTELDRLVELLPGFTYQMGATGGLQHIAILYDSECIHLNSLSEGHFANQAIDGGLLFQRQPLVAYVTLKDNGRRMNDLAVVGVHLASGKDKTRNHDMAMGALAQATAGALRDEGAIPRGEKDVLIAGDFNADRFDQSVETFWDDMQTAGWAVLAESDQQYRSTRLAGNPPGSVASRIDYIIVSQGLIGHEVAARNATVHYELIGSPMLGIRDAYECRVRMSDHLPVTVDVAVIGTDTRSGIRKT